MLFIRLPRQVLNLVTSYNLARTIRGRRLNNGAIGFRIWAAYLTVDFSFNLWFASFVGTVIACLLYIPVLCHIQGNLKEYVCRTIDQQ